MKARIVNNTIVEILTPIPGFIITDCYHEDVLAECIDTPAGAQVGWIKNDQGQWVAPPAPPRKWTAEEVRAGLTLAEKVKWDNNAAPEIITVKAELASPVTVDVITPILQLLVDAKVIAQSSMAAILK